MTSIESVTLEAPIPSPLRPSGEDAFTAKDGWDPRFPASSPTGYRPGVRSANWLAAH